ncbi:MAG TPA: hypothetical protein VF815_34060 [Myxococcaceae bacterium]|jgi:hypothetical protein
MTLPSLRTTLLSAATLALTACGGEKGASLLFSADTRRIASQSLSPVAQRVTAMESEPPLTFNSGDGMGFLLTQARIHLRDIRLDLPQGTSCADVTGLSAGVECKGSESSNTLIVDGPIVVDLLTGATTPNLGGLVIPAGTYKRIDFRLDEARADEVAVNEPLIGYSMLVGASFMDTSNKTLELRLKFSEDARFESATGVEVPEGGVLITLLNPAIWLEGLPLASCIQKGDVAFDGSVLRIDDRAKGDCSGAEDLVKRNIKRSGDLRKAGD